MKHKAKRIYAGEYIYRGHKIVQYDEGHWNISQWEPYPKDYPLRKNGLDGEWYCFDAGDTLKEAKEIVDAGLDKIYMYWAK